MFCPPYTLLLHWYSQLVLAHLALLPIVLFQPKLFVGKCHSPLRRGPGSGSAAGRTLGRGGGRYVWSWARLGRWQEAGP